MFGWYVYPTQLKINQRLRMSLKWQRIYEWRSTNGDIKATPAGRLQSDLDKIIRYISSCKPQSGKKICPFFMYYVHLMLYIILLEIFVSISQKVDKIIVFNLNTARLSDLRLPPQTMARTLHFKSIQSLYWLGIIIQLCYFKIGAGVWG